MKRRVSTTFSIPNPCNNKWEEMNPVGENKKHCSSCDRLIVDFTKMSDGELLDYFRKNKKACGKFLPYQLDRKIVSNDEKKNSPWKNIFILSSLFLGLESSAQKNKIEKIPVVQSEKFNSSSKKIKDVYFYSKPIKINIQGTVSDSITGAPIEGAIVMIGNSSFFENGITDSSGHYKMSITISSSDSVTISIDKLGYNFVNMDFSPVSGIITQNFVLVPSMNEPVVITYENYPDHLVGELVQQTITSSFGSSRFHFLRLYRVRNFFQRVLHSLHRKKTSDSFQ